MGDVAHISAAIDMDDRTQISGGMDVVKETLTSALQTPRRRVEMSVASSPSGTAFSSPYGTPSTTGGWHGPSLHDDDFEVQEMLEQVENFCSELESRCMEPLKTKCSLRLVGFSRSVAGKLKEERAWRSENQKRFAEKYQRMKSETLENSMRIIQEVQVSHKEAQGVLVNRIASLEASLHAAQDAYGEASLLRKRLLDKDSECSDLQAAVEELEEEMKQEIDARDRLVSSAEARASDLEVAGQRLARSLSEKDALLKDAQAELKQAALERENPASRGRCEWCGEAEETKQIFTEFTQAVSSSSAKIGTVPQPLRVPNLEELISQGTRMFSNTVQWGFKRMGV